MANLITSKPNVPKIVREEGTGKYYYSTPAVIPKNRVYVPEQIVNSPVWGGAFTNSSKNLNPSSPPVPKIVREEGTGKYYYSTPAVIPKNRVYVPEKIVNSPVWGSVFRGDSIKRRQKTNKPVVNRKPTVVKRKPVARKLTEVAHRKPAVVKRVVRKTVTKKPKISPKRKITPKKR